MSDLSSSDAADIVGLIKDPTFYFHGFRWKYRDAWFVRLAETDHRFHSSNAARACPSGYSVPIDKLIDACSSPGLCLRPIRYIFMTDFCGSTLLARALGALDGLFCYNEPRAFVSLANERRRIEINGTGDRAQWDAALRAARLLMGRTFDAGTMALVKDQPLTNYIIRYLLELNEDSAAVFLYSTLPEYLNAVLRQDRRRAYARERATRSFRETVRIPFLAGVDKASLSDSRVAALHWLTQMYHYLNVPQAEFSNRLSSLRSDVFREQPAQVLKAVSGFFDVPATDDAISRVMQSEIFKMHSKQVAESFDPDEELRRKAESAERYRAEIENAMEWVETVTAGWPIPDELPGMMEVRNGV